MSVKMPSMKYFSNLSFEPSFYSFRIHFQRKGHKPQKYLFEKTLPNLEIWPVVSSNHVPLDISRTGRFFEILCEFDDQD